MNTAESVEDLRAQLAQLATQTDEALARYSGWKSPVPAGFVWRIRWLAGRVLRWLESVGLKRPDPWPVALKSQPSSPDAKALLIWAVGVDRDVIRRASRRLAQLQATRSTHAPVLVTDVADFAYYSRLGWLVEYVPKIAGSGEDYQQRKAAFLARLYRDAPALPIGVGLAGEEEIRAVLSRVTGQDQRRQEP